MHTMDVDTAFLNADPEDDIWVKIQEGTRLAVGDANTNWSGHCMVLNRRQDVETISSMPTSSREGSSV